MQNYEAKNMKDLKEDYAKISSENQFQHINTQNENVTDEIRELYGIKKGLRKPPSYTWIVIIGLVLLANGYLLGDYAGMIYKNYHVSTFLKKASKMQEMTDPDEFSEARKELETLRASLIRQADVRWIMANVYKEAALHSPNRQHFYRQSLKEVDAAIKLSEKSSGLQNKFIMLYTRAGILMELNQDKECLKTLQKAKEILDKYDIQKAPFFTPEKHLYLTVDFKNTMAYLLAKSEDSDVRNPEGAMHLIKEVMCRKPEKDETPFSRNAAYLDTLAQVRLVSKEPELALKAQRRALALSEGNGLEVYIKRFDECAAAAESSISNRPE